MVGFKDEEFYSAYKKIYSKTLKWFPADFEETYDPVDNLYGPNDISYTFNSNGFRCDEFDIPSDCQIVFLGCSITEGVGVRLEESWSFVLLDKIKKELGVDIPYWNLSLSGAGLDSQVRAYYKHYDQLKPQIAIAYFPTMVRREAYIAESGHEHPVFLSPNHHFLSKLYVTNEILSDLRNARYETEKNFVLLDFMLKKYNTDFLWGHYGAEWQDIDHDFYTYYDLQIDLDRKGRDKMHPGPKAHYVFAMQLYDKFKDKIIQTLRSGRSVG